MRYRWLAVFPLLYAVVFIVIAWYLGANAGSPFVVGQKLLARVLAVSGCLAAVAAFGRGDHLRHAWLWLFVTSALVLIRDVIRVFFFEVSPPALSQAGLFLSALGVLSNVALLVGLLMLAWAWKVAAIELPGGRGGAIAVTLGAAVLAIAVAGPGAVEQGRALLQQDWSAATLFASAVVDILALCLLAPLLLTALALRGGSFGWPWALVTASVLGWLFYDAAVYYAASEAGEFPLADVFRGLALNYLFVAGLAQRFAVQQVRRSAG